MGIVRIRRACDLGDLGEAELQTLQVEALLLGATRLRIAWSMPRGGTYVWTSPIPINRNREGISSDGMYGPSRDNYKLERVEFLDGEW